MFDKDTYNINVENRPTLRDAIKFYVFLTSDDSFLICICSRGEVYFQRNSKHTYHRKETWIDVS